MSDNDGKQNSDSTTMNQVRDLLFGSQIKEIDTRFERQEARFLREVNDAKDVLRSRLDSLENFMRSETASLMHRINTEVAAREAAVKTGERERAEAFDNLSRSIASAEEAFERRMAALSGTLDNVEQEIRKLMMSETGNLNTQINEKYEDALRVIAETASQIRHDMVYRSSMSGMLTEVALKLSGQWPSNDHRDGGGEGDYRHQDGNTGGDHHMNAGGGGDA